jgi:hypothetical protein
MLGGFLSFLKPTFRKKRLSFILSESWFIAKTCSSQEIVAVASVIKLFSSTLLSQAAVFVLNKFVSLMLVSKAGTYLSVSNLLCPSLGVDPWPWSQILDWAKVTW